jgi:DNA-binding FrmR family transcriptional regulator
MNNIVLDEIKKSKCARAEIILSLQSVHSQLQIIFSMVQSGESRCEVLRSLHRAQDAINSIAVRMLLDHLERCLLVYLQTSDPVQQQQALGEVVWLYAFVCRQQSLRRGNKF